MKTTTAIAIIIGFVVALTFRFIAIADNAPHNASNNINCGSCHLPADGRYIKFYIDVGGPMASGTFMEFQYQAW